MELKHAVVVPLLKKPSLDLDDLKNFRPVSNLSFVSKCLEKIVASQLKSHLKENNLAETFQSAYRSTHSTETALVKVHNDIMSSMGKQEVTVLVLLDLSSAFDTIDHDLLLQRLEHRLGIRGSALGWFRSYLLDRRMLVKIDNSSERHPCKFGVPQGSVLGPLLFTVYILPLGDIINVHGLLFHLYADDNQLYISFRTYDISLKLVQFENCIKDIRQWMRMNFLKLNDSKTEMVLLGSRQQLKKLENQNIRLRVGDNSVAPSTSARNLGVTFDSTMSFDTHISLLSRACFYNIYNISKVSYLLNANIVKMLMQSLVTSKLDYCNALYIHLPAGSIAKLQRIQNAAARCVSKVSKSEHIYPVLRELHWLPVYSRVRYKICMLTHECLFNKDFPTYLKDLLFLYTPARKLRSSSDFLLQQPRSNSHMSARAFSVCGPQIWNSLPQELRKTESKDIFKSVLKTFLFGLAFE